MRKKTLTSILFFPLIATSYLPEQAFATLAVETTCGRQSIFINSGVCGAYVTGVPDWETAWSTSPSGKVKLSLQDKYSTIWTCIGTPLQMITVNVKATVRTETEIDRDSGFVNCLSEEDMEPASPILIDLDRNGFHLSGGPVEFDIDADGIDETLTWTSEDELDGFLYLDRNGNGIVDYGSELFGNSTELMDGSIAEHGYLALAEFDLPENGGSNDGYIDSSDSIYGDLGVWIDINSDGLFEQHESLTLSEAGVIIIDLDFKELPVTDVFGNQFKYNSDAWIEVNGKLKKTKTSDVFFNNLDE